MKQLAPGVLVIGRYQPAELYADTIGTDLVNLTNSLGLLTFGLGGWSKDWADHKAAAEVRQPKTNMTMDGNVVDWHHDAAGSDHAMVLWSNREQTEIRLPDGKVLHPESNDVLLVKNTAVMHRTPQKMSQDRWFFRRAVQVPDWL